MYCFTILPVLVNNASSMYVLYVCMYVYVQNNKTRAEPWLDLCSCLCRSNIAALCAVGESYHWDSIPSLLGYRCDVRVQVLRLYRETFKVGLNQPKLLNTTFSPATWEVTYTKSSGAAASSTCIS